MDRGNALVRGHVVYLIKHFECKPSNSLIDIFLILKSLFI